MNAQEINEKIASIVVGVEDGKTDALKAFISLKEIEKVLAASMSQIKEQAVTEAKKYGAKSFDLLGCRIDVKDGTARYSYKHISQWSSMSDSMKRLEEAAKLRAKNPSVIIADDNGEEILPAQITFDKESIAITLPKL